MYPMGIDYIVYQIEKLPPGKGITFSKFIIDCLITPWDGTLLTAPVEDRIMERIIGSSFSIRYMRDPMTGNLYFYRMEKELNNGLRTFVSQDRQHLFKRREDGLWERNNE